MKTSRNVFIAIAIIILVVFLALIMFFSPPRVTKSNKIQTSDNISQSCSIHTCGAIDDVNNPAYNMKNIVKQSILLEEHIAEKNKYCLSCICKHFNHIIGLAEEAVWLAGSKIDDYPFLNDSVDYYQRAFDKWLANKHDENVKRTTLDTLRERRRQLIDVYFLAH